MRTQADKRCRADAASRHPNCNFRNEERKLPKYVKKCWIIVSVCKQLVVVVVVCAVLKVVGSSLLQSARLGKRLLRPVECREERSRMEDQRYSENVLVSMI